ncbi:hypothetical protein KTC96_22505 (plasmid) [Clostridium estertheticum]|uniref:hypothetical protein n=1 Tax=Clostridium estertheticum TaxID=238834 RepID=UPI001C7DCBB0|nr:hypothetical protein [Clostridium estertheticum]MBX4260431.1 hypothetical protein [Clostridium estertheticum]WLC72990.1 hypothetical protein KTC96_22505 [Clostridium estertheticum]
MNDTILCLIDFLRDKDYLNSRNKIVISITLVFGTVMDTMLYVVFRDFINTNRIDQKLIVSGYFLVISLIYLISAIPDKMRNLGYVKSFFVFPVKYKDIFFSIIFFGFFSYKNIPLGVALCLPAFLFSKSILSFTILLIESILILLIVELISIILCETYKCMSFSKLMALLSIIITIFLFLLIKFFYYDLINFFGVGYLKYNIILILLCGFLIICFYKISYLLFKLYKCLFQTS